MQSIDKLARQIIDLTPAEQQALLERVVQLNLQKGCMIWRKNIVRV